MLVGTGCATIVKGTTQPIPIASEPTGARVLVDGQPKGTTPVTVDMQRKHTHVVTLELPGYDTENISITNSVGGAVAGNIIAGGLIGWGVDATSGAQYNLSPKAVNVRLRQTTQQGAAPISKFESELARLESLRTRGVISDEEYAKMRAALVAAQ